jgi:hypothetical protein
MPCLNALSAMSTLPAAAQTVNDILTMDVRRGVHSERLSQFSALLPKPSTPVDGLRLGRTRPNLLVEPVETPPGRTWLIVGALFTAISLAVLLPMTALAPPGVALTAVTLDFVFYAGMLAARFAVPSGRRRLALMAVALLAIAVASFAAALIVAFARV